MKLKIISATGSSERRFSSWIGGSILASLVSYCISLVIRQSFFSFQNNTKNLDPSNKMYLDLWGCLGRVKHIL